MIHGKSLLTPDCNPTYNRHYYILVLTIGSILKYGFGATCWGCKPISMNDELHISSEREGSWAVHNISSPNRQIMKLVGEIIRMYMNI